MYKKFFAITFVLIMAAFLTACGSGKETNASVDASSVTTAEKTGQVTTGEVAAQASPTPSPVPETAAVDREEFKLPVDGVRPVAVMIDNEGTRSLPQGGLDKAQVIYEIIVEGGETRLMPVFWDTDVQMIGPVRSSRHYFLDFVMEHDAIYVHFGWSPMAQKDIPKFKINNINGISNGGEIFWDLTRDRGNWQDSYTSMQKILDYVKKVKYRTSTDNKTVFKYNQSDVELLQGQKAEKISLRYSSSYTCGFEYDSAVKAYKRLRKGAPQMERVSGKQLEAKNIIIQFVPNYGIKGDSKDRQDVKTTGSGKGYYITCGKAENIKWSKESRSEQTRYTDEAGNEIILNRGQTWVQILPVSGKAAIE